DAPLLYTFTGTHNLGVHFIDPVDAAVLPLRPDLHASLEAFLLCVEDERVCASSPNTAYDVIGYAADQQLATPRSCRAQGCTGLRERVRIRIEEMPSSKKAASCRRRAAFSTAMAA